MDPEIVLASSPSDDGIACWDLLSGAELLRFRTCASPPHGLNIVGGRFIASSQLQDASSSSGSIFYWSSNKPQVEVKSFPSEPIKPLVSHREGTYLVGGGVSGNIYFWEVATGSLLKKWQGHYRAVSCLVFSDDQSFLISGAEDGSIRVWSLFALFDDTKMEKGNNLYEYSFYDHSLAITDIVVGHGGCNSIIVSASEDQTCKVWGLFNGKLLRNITFPSVINAVAIDPCEHVFYAGSKDGKVYIAAPANTNSSYGKYIIDSTFYHSEAVTCLKLASNGTLLVSGSVSGMVCIWDTRTRMIVRNLKLCKGSPVNNILVVRQSHFLRPHGSSYSQSASQVKHKSLLPPPLKKYSNSTNELGEFVTYLTGNEPEPQPRKFPYISGRILTKYMKELQQQGSSAASEVEVEKLKLDYESSKQMVKKQKKMYEDLYKFCANEVLNREQAEINFNGALAEKIEEVADRDQCK